MPPADSWPARIAHRIERRPAALAVVGVIVATYLGLAALLIGSGVAFTHVVGHGRIGHWDDHVNAWFAAHRIPAWNKISADVTLVADTLGVVVVAAAVTALLFARRWGHRALLLTIGLAVELSVFLSTTYLVRRPRPHVTHLGSTPSTFSWPSGHTAATVVVYGGIAVIVTAATARLLPRVVAWVVAATLTVAVALSRVYRGEHHPTDTIAGLVLGIGALISAVFVVRVWGACGRGTPSSEERAATPAEPESAPVAAAR